MKVQKFILRLFLLSSLVVTVSCAEFRERFGRKDPNTPPKIRIVDLSGNPKPIKTFVPEGNVQALSDQERFESNPRQNYSARNQNALTPEVPYVAQDDLSTIPTPAPIPALEQNQNLARESAKESEVVVSYDMSNDEKIVEEVEVQKVAADEKFIDEKSSGKKFKFVSQKMDVPQETKSVKTKVKKFSGSQKFVQIGSFSNRDSAQEVLNKNAAISSGKIQEVNIAGRTNYRVLLGPSDGQNAKQILTQARNAGYNDAFIAK